jgi:hypothetical protein
MLPLTHVLSPNAGAVAGEVIDGEAIIIDLSTGVYYSMDGVGGSIWALIEAERSLGEIVAAIVARYEAPPERVHTDVQELVAELVREQLVLVSERESPSREDQEPAPERKLAYDTPRLNTYRDMGDLLALDPPVPGLQDIPWKTSAEKPLE